MPVSQSGPSSSIDLSALPARVSEALAGLVAVCREPLASAPCPAAFEEMEQRVRASVNALGCEVLGAWVEGLDDGALRVDRAGQRWLRAAAPAFARAGFAEDDHDHTRCGEIPTGALSPRREPDIACARGRVSGAGERLPDAPGRPARADDDGPLHGAGSGRVLLADGRHGAVGEHLAAARAEPAQALGEPGAAGAGEHPRRRGHPARGSQRLGLARRRHGGAAGRRGRARRSLLARGGLRHRLLPRRRGRAAEDPLSRPHARERQAHAEGATRKRGRASPPGAPRYRHHRHR